jgi:hypothetical protein
MRHKVLHTIEMALRGSDGEGCAAIIVVGIYFPAKNVKGLDKKNIAIESGPVKSELFVCYSDLGKFKILGLFNTLHTSVIRKVLNNSRILSIIERSGTPSISRARVRSVLDKELDDINVTSCCGEM